VGNWAISLTQLAPTSIAEAVRLVPQSAALAGGTFTSLDMGEELSVAAFASRLVRLCGLRVHRDIAMVFTCLGPGERMTEKLVGDRGTMRDASYPQGVGRGDQRAAVSAPMGSGGC
jgi:FlaA1/EpsC-like NDP-sugar epimerase